MRLILVIVFVLVNTTMYAQAEQKYVRRGNSDYEAEKFREAEIYYRKALEKNQESVKANYNLGNAMYRQNQYEAAAARYDNLIKQTENPAEISRYYYNLGNTFFKSQKIEESIDAYRNALLNNPDDVDAKHNLQMALRMLQEKNQSGSGGQDNNQEQNDQQNQSQQQDQQNGENPNNQDNPQGEQNGQNPENAEQQPERGQISPEDAERILQALENEEKDVLKKVQEQQEKQLKKIPVEKNW